MGQLNCGEEGDRAVVMALPGTYHKLYAVIKSSVSCCFNDHGLSTEESKDIPITPPRAQLAKYLAELGSIFPKGSLGSIVAIFLVRRC